MFESSSGVERNTKVQLMTVVILISVACCMYFSANLNAPKIESVNGIYRNACCRDVVLKDGHLSYGDRTFGFKLLNMKFGLTGYVDARFTRKSIQRSEDETAIEFLNEGEKRALSLPVDRRNYTFQLVP